MSGQPASQQLASPGFCSASPPAWRWSPIRLRCARTLAPAPGRRSRLSCWPETTARHLDPGGQISSAHSCRSPTVLRSAARRPSVPRDDRGRCRVVAFEPLPKLRSGGKEGWLHPPRIEGGRRGAGLPFSALSGRRQRARLVDQRLRLGDPGLGLLLVDRLAVERRGIERRFDLARQRVTLRGQALDRVLERCVA